MNGQICFLPDGSRAYVSLENDGALAVIDAQHHKFLRRLQLEGKGNTPKPRQPAVSVGLCSAIPPSLPASLGDQTLMVPFQNWHQLLRTGGNFEAFSSN